MNIMKKYFIFFLIAFPLLAGAQNTLYFLEGVHQNKNFNPAFVPDAKFHLELPGLGGISSHAYNSGFNYNWLDNFIESIGTEGYDTDEAVSKIGEFNHFFTETQANLLSFGVRLKDQGYLTLSATMNSSSEMKVEPDIVYLLADIDDISSDDLPVVVEGIDFLTNNYLSFGVTYSRAINDQLTLGVTPHLNFNFIGIQTKDVRLTVDEEDLGGGDTEITTDLDGEVKLGLPTELNPDAVVGDELDLEEDFLPDGWASDLAPADFLQNPSLSLDIGATYALNEWMFSASMLNIGASGWKNNGYILRGQGEVVKVEDDQKVKVGIPPRIFLGAKRQFHPKWNYALLLRNDFYKAASNASATLSLNGFVGKWLSTSVSYTAGYKFNNIGIGLRMRFLPGTDLFLVTDNLIQSFAPKDAHRMTAAAGINLTFGEDYPFLRNKKTDQ